MHADLVAGRDAGVELVGKISIEWPGQNQLWVMPRRRNSSSRRGTPTSPANTPREMSQGESCPPYEPSQPPTASTSVPNATRISRGIVASFVPWIGVVASCGAAGAERETAGRLGSGPMREILTVLEDDAHASPERIAALTGIAEDDVRATIASWEADGVIRRYRTVVDWDRYGDARVTAFVDVTVAPERGRGFDDVAERIARFREIRSVHLVSGAQDLRVEVEGASMREVADFVAQRLAAIDRVTATSTHFLLRRYKDDGQLLIDAEPDQRLSVTP